MATNTDPVIAKVLAESGELLRNERAAQPSPIEVWLTQANLEVTCNVVREDESTYGLEVSALSMRGAQREMTGHFISMGYRPVGRWTSEFEDRDGEDRETSRKFKLASDGVA